MGPYCLPRQGRGVIWVNLSIMIPKMVTASFHFNTTFLFNRCGYEIRQGQLNDFASTANDEGNSRILHFNQTTANNGRIRLELRRTESKKDLLHLPVLHFGNDLMKIHNTLDNQPPSLLELCLRSVYQEGLHIGQTNRAGNYAKVVDEPEFKRSSRFNPKDLGMYSSASKSLYEDVNLKAAVSEIVIDPNPKEKPWLPPHLRETLDQDEVARCLSCMKPMFTEAWISLEAVPKQKLQNNPQHLPDEDLMRITSKYFCSSRCCKSRSALSSASAP